MSFHHPPDGSVGGLRWAGLSKALVPLGWEVDVVTSALDVPPPGPGVHVHSVPPFTTINDRYRRWAKGRRRAVEAEPLPPAPGSGASMVAGPSTPEAPGLLRASVAWARQNASHALAFPDWGRGWILRAAWRTRRLLRRHAFDVLVTSGPPHSAHLVGLLAGVPRDTVWRVDMRDPWLAAMPSGPGFGIWSAYPPLVRAVVERADGIITNTEGFQARLRASQPGLDVQYVPNGIDVSRLPRTPAPKFDELSLIHAGTFYGRRDISPVFEALGRFVAAHPEATGKVRLRLIGNVEDEHQGRVERLIGLHRLEGVVELLGTVPGTEALELVHRSHLALVLAQQQPVQVPAKLYESVGMGVPTLAITESTSATAGEARRLGAMSCESHDVAGIERVIEELWRDREPTRRVPLAEISYDGVAVRMDALLRGDVARKRGRSPA